MRKGKITYMKNYQNNQQKLDKWTKFKEPKYTAKLGLISAVISFFIFGKGCSIVAIIFGIIGTFYGIKQKSGWKIIFLNVLAIILGLVSRILLEIVLKS